MEWFDAYEEVAATVERFVAENGRAPVTVSVSPTLYAWLAKLQAESAALESETHAEPVSIDTSYGTIPIVIDEQLGAYEIQAD